jgi:hypothetical protein
VGGVCQANYYMYVGDDEFEADPLLRLRRDAADPWHAAISRPRIASPSIAPFDWIMHDQRNYTTWGEYNDI